MISIIEHIEYLIIRHDCVIIPGVGALIAHYSPAQFDAHLGFIKSPSRSVSFNSSINYDDGILVDSIRRKERVSFNEAQVLMQDELSTIKKQLAISGELPCGKLGSFKMDDGVLSFEPFNNEDIQQKFFGLSNIIMPSLDNQAIESDDIHSSLKSGKNNFFNKRYFVRYVASLLLLIGLSFILTTPITISQKNIEYASFNVVDIKDNVPETSTTVKDRKLYDQICISEKCGQEKIPVKEINKEINKFPVKTNVKTLVNVENARYYLIVASLPSRGLAEKHISQSHDENLRIIECDGKYRIYIASCNTFKKIQSINSNSEVSKKYPSTWIYKKN